MLLLLCSLAVAASWDAPPTPQPLWFVPDAAARAAQAEVSRVEAEQVGADLAREASRTVAGWYEARLPILERGEYGGQVASLRDDLARHVARLDQLGIVARHDEPAHVAAAVRAVPHRGTGVTPLPDELGDWRPSGALEAWIDQLDHLARVAERQAFGLGPDEDGGAMRLASEARYLMAGFERLRLAGC